MRNRDAQDARVAEILGDRLDNDECTFEDCVDAFYKHLGNALQLPCDVTGIEDFRWEEFYIFGPGNKEEYEHLRQTQPSYKDIFELMAIETDVYGEWIMCSGEDVAAHVRRKSDGKEFYLGLSEIKAVDKTSLNHQLIYDYAVWFVNNR